ncbi:MAG: hypothetical protein GYA23_09340, partial [Methanomicrobiales archaeon]|nr:hypothetical protein [Methanomicrobiales archaeon]
MIFLRQKDLFASHHRSLAGYPVTRTIVAGILLILLLPALVVPAAADDFTTKVCENPGVEFTYFPATAGPYPATVHFEAKESNCVNCQWTWTIGRVGFESATYEDTFHYNNIMEYTFNRPGRYYVNVEVFVPDQCDGWKSAASKQEIIEI